MEKFLEHFLKACHFSRVTSFFAPFAIFDISTVISVPPYTTYPNMEGI